MKTSNTTSNKNSEQQQKEGDVAMTPQLSDAEFAKQHLVDDIKAIERIKNQKIEMLKILEKRTHEIEDRYLEKTLNGNGNVFNGWIHMKPGSTSFGTYTHTQGLTKPGAIAPSKRTKKITDKEKEKEKIY